MAARWGAREDSLATGNMEYFSTYTLDEVGVTRGNIDVLDMSDQLDAGDALEAFHGCLDSSILSIFEDSAAAEEVRCRIDEESEAALLTALTEVLDNVDGGTLSPFDTLPDPELFSGQKGREQSPLRRLRSLARSPLESEPLCSHRSITSYLGNVEGTCSDRHWKAKPLLRSQDVALQRSDGEEEEDLVIDGGLAQGPLCDAELPSLDAVELGALLNEDWDHASLDDMARHMHPYCLAVSVDLVEGEQVLPEGWIMLEVVDRGEQGEPILAVAEALPPVQQGAPEEEHPGTTTPINETPCFAPITEERSEEAGEEERKKQTVQKCPSGRRKKRKTKGQKVCVKPRVLRSMQPEHSLEAGAPETAKEKQPENKSQTLGKKKRVSFAPVLASVLDAPTSVEFVPYCTLERPSCPAPPTATTDSPPGPESLKPLVGDGPTAPVPQQLEEARPKPLSLQQYRLLRQQKRPAPVEKQEGNSTKWPTLPEPPSELPPIPCLLETVPTREPQRAPAERMGTGVVQVWQPKNSTAPPTPEALLFPPGSVVPPSKALGPVLVPKLAGGMQNQNQLAAPAPKLASAVEVKPQESVSCVARQSHLAPLDQPILRSDGTPLQGSHRQPSLPSRLPTVEKALPAWVLPIAQALCPPATQATNDAPVSKTTALPKVAPVTKLTKGPMPAQAGLPAASLPTRGRPQRVAQKKLLPSETSPTDKLLIQTFTSEIGIEAADLTSLLEQFEETQAKEEHAVPEVCGRAAAVGNSGKAIECLGVPDLGSTAGLTPPATPPHPTWKPLAPAALLATPKPSASKSVQIIEPRPMPPCKARSKSTVPPAATVQPPLDHDYCLPSGEPLVTQPSTYQRGKRQQEEQAVGHVNQPLDHRTLVEKGAALAGSVLLSPDASPTRPETDALVSIDKKLSGSGKRGSRLSERSAAPPARERGRVRMRYRVRSPSTESSSRSGSSSGSSSESRSRSRSCSPPRKRFCSRSRRSESSSSSSDSSCYSPSRSPPRRRRYSYSSSRSGSWSRSQSRSCSPRWRRRSRSPSPSHRNGRRYDSREQFQCQEVKNRKEKAIEERRVVYVGKIRGGMTRKELKERFSLYGEIEECALHFRDHGDNYGFVTYYNTKDAFNAIENGSKLRQSDELPFDLCFGGRRQFCRSNYADLDSNRDYDPTPKKSKLDTLDFDTLLKQAQKGLRR